MRMKMQELIKEYIMHIEIKMGIQCHKDENKAYKEGVPYECKCSDPFLWSDEEVIEWMFNYDS